MKKHTEEILKFNDEQFLSDLKKADKVWIRAGGSGLFRVTKTEVIFTASYSKMKYEMYQADIDNLVMIIN